MKYQTELKEYGGQFDVIVCGGGTSGAVAAITAAKLGLKTLVVEKYGALGGTQTMAFVHPLMYSYAGSKYKYSSTNEEIVKELRKYGAVVTEDEGEHRCQWFDRVALQSVLEELIKKYNGNILYDTVICDVIKEKSALKGIVAVNGGGTYFIRGDYFIDSTADGDVSVFAGAQFSSGNKDGKNQSVSLRFEMGGVDIDTFKEFLNSKPAKKNWEPNYVDVRDDVNGVVCVQQYETEAFDGAIKQAVADGALTARDKVHLQMFFVPGRKGVLSFNCPELGSGPATDPGFVTEKYIDGKESVMRIAGFMKNYIPGFTCAYINDVAPMLGVRESREIHTEYLFTIDEAVAFTKFEDGFVKSNYPIDIHGAGEGRKIEYKKVPPDEKYFEVPLRSLIVKGTDNLMVAGRCIGTDFYTQSSVRVQHSARASGEAAAIAVWHCKKRGVPCREADGKQVRAKMREMGADI